MHASRSPALDAGSSTASPAARLARAFAENFERWKGLRLRVHVGCLLVLALVPVVRWWPTVSETVVPLGDEVEYFAAFEHVVEGRSPFAEDNYLYPSAFAYAGAWSLELLGRTTTDVLLRAINLLGLAVAIWCSMAWLPWSASRRLLAGVAFILVAPQVSYSVLFNNFSLAVAGMLLGGLLLASRRSIAAGLLLGGSVALKPIAPMAVGCLLFAHRETRERHLRWAAVVAIIVAAALILPDPHLDELLALTADTERVAASITLHRFPQLFGFEPNALWISVPLALVAVALIATRRLGRARLLCLAVTASVAVTPLVWSHTLVVLLPLEVLALAVAAKRWAALRQRPSGVSRLPSWLEPVLVVLAVASIQLSSGAGSIGDQNVVLQLFGAGVPAVSPLALLAYLLVMTDAF
ncbi:MAG: glycosyltransferase 87 family protein [Thermoanaerobaculia bacterium]